MKLGMIRGILVGVAAALGLAVATPPAEAIEAFLAELQAKYVKPDSKKANDVALAIAFEQARCTICHPGDDTHTLSPYGSKLSMRVSKSDKDKKKKIQEALTEVGALRSDPYDPKSPTYDELFHQGQLPPGPSR